MKVGFIGLGKMGSRMVKKLLAGGHEVIAWNRSQESIDQLVSQLTPQELQGFTPAENIEKLVAELESPKIIWLMLPAGEATQSVLDEVEKYIEKGDIVIDGGNAHFADTQKRFDYFAEKGIRFLGIGVSGGIIAATEGYPLMVGGERTAYEYITPMLNTLSESRGGFAYFGEGGAGHFVKMVHNGIEYGIMQSLAEGFEVLEKSSYSLDLLKIAKLYQKNTLVSGFMLDRVVDALQNDPGLAHTVGIIAESGEATWTVEEAEKENVDVPIIRESLEYRRKSQTDKKIQNSFTAKLVAALRNVFGGHKVEKK